MKKLFFIASALMFNTTVMKAQQITLDYSNDTLTYGETSFFRTDISKNESKYVIVNKKTNSFSLYNMDMTPFMSVVIPYTDSIKHGFVVAYISRTLFDCDSTNIEYVYESPYQGQKPFRILRTDGTVLLEVDSARGPYCYGCWGGSQISTPIQKTSEGTKLFLDILNDSGLGMHIYSLCGELPTDYINLPEPNSYVKLFPNPSDMSINFEVVPPNNMEEFELVIYQSNGSEMKRNTVKSINDRYGLDVSNFSSGTYFYSLVSKNKAYQTGKFIISK
ncbi:MAG TPA: T9SS type A sorting domain-containing protein [Chitinophagales bacterium]|nr:T9SS type A sorting domain-containing protein [Chitinophagales bacterium]